jgi:hypothetical protein
MLKAHDHSLGFPRTKEIYDGPGEVLSAAKLKTLCNTIA